MDALFSTLSEVEIEIDRASVSRDAEFLTGLDEKYDSAWQNILRHEPQTACDAEQMLTRLLERMCETAEQGGNVAQVREKIVELFEMKSISGEAPARSNHISQAEPTHA